MDRVPLENVAKCCLAVRLRFFDSAMMGILDWTKVNHRGEKGMVMGW